MSVLLQERMFHPTYLRLLCLHVRRRGVSHRRCAGRHGHFRARCRVLPFGNRSVGCLHPGSRLRRWRGSWNYYRAGAQSADVYHAVYTIAMWGVAPIWRLCGGGSDHQEIWKQEIEAPPEQSITRRRVYAACKRVALDCTVSHSKGDRGNNLGASWYGQKSKIAANDIVEATR